MNEYKILKTLLIYLVICAPTVLVSDDVDLRLSQLENQMHQVLTENAMGTNGVKTATSRVEVDGYKINLNLDLFYWQPKQSCIQYGYVMDKSENITIGEFPQNGTIQTVDLGFDLGFKTGVDIATHCDSWNLGVLYTYFRGHSKGFCNAGHSEVIVPMYAPINVTQDPDDVGQIAQSLDLFLFCEQASLSIGTKIDMLDAVLSRSFFISPKLSFDPSIGIKALWVKQTFSSHYSGGQPFLEHIYSNTMLGLSGNNVKIQSITKTWGIGPSFDAGSKWHLGKGFGVIGTAQGAILYGNMKNDYSSSYSGFEDNTISMKNNYKKIRPVVSSMLGLSYSTYLNQMKQHLEIGLAYENMYIFSTTELFGMMPLSTYPGFSPLELNGKEFDLGIHGVSLNLNWSF